MSIPPSSVTVCSTISRQYASSVTSPGSETPVRSASSTSLSVSSASPCSLGELRYCDVGALAGERERHGLADAGVAAGDQRAPALKAPAAAVALLAVVGEREHVGLVAGVVQRQLGLLRLRVLCRRGLGLGPLGLARQPLGPAARNCSRHFLSRLSEMSCSRQSSVIGFGPRNDASTSSVFCRAVNFPYLRFSLNRVS
jgi:hypothetical protein